jgi:hypothetical protein
MPPTPAIPKSRKWMGFTLGLALLLALAGGEIALRTTRDPKVTIGGNDEVYYYRRATREDALALGEALKATGFFNGRGTSVLLWEGGGPTTVSFVVADGAWDHPNAISNFTEIGRRIAHSVGGFPIQVHLIDSGRVIRKKMTVGKTIIGSKDILYYFGIATSTDSQAFGHALQSAGYFADRGFTVALLKGEGTVISFVVQEGSWDNPDVAATLDRLVRQVAPSVGGLPIELRLLNQDMEIKKQMEVR